MAVSTQTLDILKALQSGERLTALDALNRFDCMRLGARIWDLRHEFGIEVKSEQHKLPNGKTVSRYYIEQPATEQVQLDLDSADAHHAPEKGTGA